MRTWILLVKHQHPQTPTTTLHFISYKVDSLNFQQSYRMCSVTDILFPNFIDVVLYVRVSSCLRLNNATMHSILSYFLHGVKPLKKKKKQGAQQLNVVHTFLVTHRFRVPRNWGSQIPTNKLLHAHGYIMLSSVLVIPEKQIFKTIAPLVVLIPTAVLFPPNSKDSHHLQCCLEVAKKTTLGLVLRHSSVPIWVSAAVSLT